MPIVGAAQDFTGLYVGGFLSSVNNAGEYTAFTPKNSFAGFDVQDLDASVLGGGLQVGSSWDMGGYLLGIEASITGFGSSATSTRSIEEGTVSFFSREVQNQLALTPRIGWVVNNSLLYAKAGLAMSKVGAMHDQNGTLIEGSSSETGWIIGLGAEGPLSDRLNAKIELSHADFGSDRYDLGTSGRWVEQEVTTNMLSVGISHYFN